MTRKGITVVRALAVVLAFAAASSCSTTRVLGEGEYRLEKNRIEVVNDPGFNVREVQPYVKQHAGTSFLMGWNPLVNVYNWSSKSGRGFFSKVLRGIGTAPVVYNPELVEASVENIGNHLEYIGYYGSKVESEVSVNRRKVTVDYKITLGKTYKISDIDFVLPSGGEFAADFLADTVNLSVKKGDILSEDALEAETARSSAYMRNLGYYGFTKNYYTFEADTLSGDGLARLEMKVMDHTRNETSDSGEPHRKFKFGNVTISHDKDLKFKEKILREMNLITPGAPYSESIVNTTYSRLSQLNVFNSVNIGMTKADTNVVDCSINLSQSRTQGFKVNLEASTNSSGLMGVSPRLSYYHKNIFGGGERLSLSFLGNFQFRLSDDIHSNELGFSTGLSIPRLIGIPMRFFRGPVVPRTEINFSDNFQSRPEFTRNRISTSFGYTGIRLRRALLSVYPLQVNIVRIFDMDPDFYNNLAQNRFLWNAYQDHFDAGSSMTLAYSTTTSPNPKETYNYFRLQVDASGNVLSLFNSLMKQDEFGNHLIWGVMYSQYVKGEFSIGKTWVFGKEGSQAIATRFLAGVGYAFGNTFSIPFEKQFYSGGASSLRGWQARSIGPGNEPLNELFIIPSQTGDVKFEANIEYRFPLFWKLGGAVFVDAGNIWTVRENGFGEVTTKFSLKTAPSQIAANTGFGLRLDLNFLLLRLDMGLKFHDPSRQENKWISPRMWFERDGYAVHFGVGYPF